MECFDQASFCFENRAPDAPKARQDAPRCPKTPQNSPKIPPRRPEDAPRCARDGSKRLQEAPRRPKTHPRRRKTPARRPKTPPRCDFGGFRVPNWTKVGHPRAAQTHVLLSFCSVGRVPKPTNTLLTDSPNDGLVPRAPTSIHRSASAGSRSEKNYHIPEKRKGNRPAAPNPREDIHGNLFDYEEFMNSL